MPTRRSVAVKLKADISSFEAKMAAASASAKGFAESLDDSNDRMSVLTQSVLALGPALVPLGAVAVPAISGIATGLTAAGVAAGVTALAFSGVGDALTALNKYQLDPTQANLEKVKQAFDDLGPAAGEFVFFLDQLQPEIDKLQSTAAAGLLPGVQEGIKHLLDLMPRLVDITDTVAHSLGDIAENVGEGFTNPEWRDFFDYIDSEAAPILHDMATTVGNLATGFADMLVALDPLTDDFSHVLVKMSGAFRSWAQGLEGSKGLENFIDYVERVGPEVGETLQDVAGALIDLAQAAAPVGGASLKAIQGIAEAISTLANSPAGPALIGLAAGLAAVSRAVGLFKAAQGSALSSVFRRLGRLGSVGFVAGIGAAALAVERLAQNNQDLTAAVKDANNALSEQEFDLKNNRDAFLKLNQELNESKLTRGTQALVAQGSQIGRVWNEAQGAWNRFFGTTVPEASDALDDFTQETFASQQHIARFRQALMGGKGLDEFTTNVQKLQSTMDTAVPILQKAGYSIDHIRELLKTPAGRQELVGAIRDYNQQASSVPGKTKAVSKALDGLSGDLKDTTTKAQDLTSALDSLFEPTLNAAEATSQWREDLVKLGKGLLGAKDKNGDLITSLKKGTVAGEENRQMFIDRVRSLKDTVEKQAQAGKSAQHLTGFIKRNRQALLDAADSAGYNRDQVKKLLDQYNLTPKFVKTIIEALGVDKSKQDAKDVKDKYDKIPKDVNTTLNAVGAVPMLGTLGSIIRSLDTIDGYTAVSRTVNYDTHYETTRYRVIGHAPGGRVVYATGGLVSGPGTSTSDSIPARLSDGEYVMRASAVEKYGVQFFNQLNTLRLAQGGPVHAKPVSRAPAGGNVTVDVDLDRLAGMMRSLSVTNNNYGPDPQEVARKVTEDIGWAAKTGAV